MAMKLRGMALAAGALLLAVRGMAQSGGELRGRVVDSSGAQVAGARVDVLDFGTRVESQRVLSDGHGDFAATGLAPGRYLVSISAAGFRDVHITMQFPRETADTVVRMQPEDCDAPGVICDSVSTPTVNDPHPIVLQTSMRLAVGAAIDLASRNAMPSDSPAAVIGLAEMDGGLYLSGLHGATLMPSCDGETNKYRRQEIVTSLRIDGFGPRTLTCAHTSQGQLAKIYITREVIRNDREIEISVVVRKR